MVNSISFHANVEAYGNRIVIPKKKAADLGLKPGDEVKVVMTKT